MTPLLRAARRWFWGTIALALILTAVLLSAARLALPFAAEYRGEVASYLSDYLEATVAIGSLDVEWHGLGPRLRVEDVAIAAPAGGGAPARVERAYLELAPAWPRAGTWLPLRVRDVVLAGIDARIRLDAHGGAAQEGIRIGRGERTVGELAAHFAAVERLHIRDSRITLVRPERAPVILRDVAMRLTSEGARHRMTAEADLPPAFGGRMRAAFDLRGPRGAYRKWRGSGYLRGDDLAVAAWQDLLGLNGAIRAAGRGNVELWTDWADGALQRAQMRTTLRDLALTHAGGPDAAFARLDGRFAWTRTADGWRVDAGDLTVERGGRRWHTDGFSLAHAPGAADGAEWRGQVDFARIEDVLALVRLAPWPDVPLANWTEGRKLRGDVRGLRFALGGGPARARAAVQDLGWAAGETVPGVRGIDGTLAWSGGRGRIDLATADATVRVPDLLRAPVPVADLRGRIDIARTADGLRIRAPQLKAANADVRTTSRLAFDWPTEGEPRVDLEVELDQGDGRAVPRYLPVGVMGPELVDWLDRAFVAGRVERGEIVWRGAVADFPHETRAGTFRADLQVRDVQLDYASDWPGLLKGDGRIRFAGRSLSVEAPDAHLLDTDLRALSVGIADFADARLRIRADAQGPLADLVEVVNEGPLEELGAFFGGVRTDGRAGLRLDLQVPLRHPEDAVAEGRVQLHDNRFAQPRFGLDLNGLEGAVRFTDGGVQIDNLTARLGGKQVRIDASTASDPEHRLRVDVSGRLGQLALLPGLPEGIAERIQGAAPWDLQVDVPLGPARRDRPIVLRGSSDLVGTTVTLPAPLGKPGDEARVLRFEFPLARDGGLEAGRIAYGDRLTADLALAGQHGDLRVAAGRVQFGPGALPPPGQAAPADGLQLRGDIAELDLAAWARLVRAARTGNGSGGAMGLASVDLQIGQTRLYGYSVSDTRVRAAREGADWRIDLAGEQIAGHARIPETSGAQPARLRLTRLVPRPLEPAGSDAAAAASPVDPAALPPFDMRIEDLVLPTGRLRQVALVTVPIPDGLAIRRLQFANSDLRLDGSGHWRGGDEHESAFSLELASDNFGEGLDALGLGGALGRGDGRVTADLAWPGSPWEPSLAALEGQARLRLDDGVFKPVDPGLARVFGLLDLRGMLEYGFQFAEFTGRVDFADGRAQTDNLTIDGSAGQLRFRGSTDLVAREYDHTIGYRPELNRSLPLFGALSGGPVAGLTVALVQSVLRNLGADMERAAEFTYSLTGPWDDPNVERVTTDPNGPERSPRSTGGEGRR